MIYKYPLPVKRLICQNGSRNLEVGVLELKRLEATIEAVLFTMGEAVELERIAAVIEHDSDTTKNIIRNMMDKYEQEDRGVQIVELDGAFQMCTKAEMYDSLVRIAHIPKKQVLTDILLETLSIIAYKQPITKVEIEAIRGVKSDHAVNKLVEYELVEEVGRMDAPGRPVLFGTSEEFLRSFGIGSIDELPILNSDKLENFKQEAEEEIQLSLKLV